MAEYEWQEAINILRLHRLWEDDKITIPQMAKGVSNLLKQTSYFHSCDPELTDIICEFEALDKLSDIHDYETALDMLYEFGDKDYRLWVEGLVRGGLSEEEDEHQDDSSNANNENSGIRRRRAIALDPPKSIHITTTTQESKKHKTYKYLTDDEFNKKAAEYGINHEHMNSELRGFIKGADEDFQNWLLRSWVYVNSDGDVRKTPPIVETIYCGKTISN
jgi:hypothetical protein